LINIINLTDNLGCKKVLLARKYDFSIERFRFHRSYWVNPRALLLFRKELLSTSQRILDFRLWVSESKFSDSASLLNREEP